MFLLFSFCVLYLGCNSRSDCNCHSLKIFCFYAASLTEKGGSFGANCFNFLGFPVPQEATSQNAGDIGHFMPSFGVLTRGNLDAMRREEEDGDGRERKEEDNRNGVSCFFDLLTPDRWSEIRQFSCK